MERRLAHGTSLAAPLPIALASAITFAASDKVDWPVVIALAVGSITGAIIGTQLLQVIDKRLLVIIFVVTILATAVRLLLADETTGMAGFAAYAVDPANARRLWTLSEELIGEEFDL